MEANIFYKSRISPFRDRFEFEETYDLLFSTIADTTKKEKAFNLMAIWKIRLSNNTPTGILCTMEIIEAQIHDSKMSSKNAHFDVIVSYSNAITRYLNFLTSLKHDTDDAENMKSVAEAIGIPVYLMDLRVTISHTQQYPSLKVLRRAAQHCLEFIKQKYWNIEKIHIRETMLETIQQPKTVVPAQTKELTKVEKKSLTRQYKNKQLLEIQLAIYDFVVELGHKYEIKKHKDLDGKQFILPTAQLESMLSYFNGKKMTKELNVFSMYEDIIIKDIEETLQLFGNEAGEYFTEAVFNRCGFFKESAAKAQKRSSKETQVLAHAYQKLFHLLHKLNYLPAFVEKLFNVCENEEKPLAACYWLQVVINSLNKHENVKRSYDIHNLDYVNLHESSATVKFSIDFIEARLGNINGFTRDITLSCLGLVQPYLTDEKEILINQLVKTYLDPPQNITSNSTEDQLFTINDILASVPAEHQQRPAQKQLTGLDRKRKYGAWQYCDSTDNPIDWKKLSLGFEIMT